MSDPRNAAHDKKVAQAKKHQAGAEAQDVPGTSAGGNKQSEQAEPDAAPTSDHSAAQSPAKTPPAELEASLAVLANLKEMEFHSRANVERLGEMMSTVQDKLKQKQFVEVIGEIYSAQDALQAKLLSAIQAWRAECDRLQSPEA